MDDALISLIPGAEQLVALYGHWPSFHDAALRSVIISAEPDDPDAPTVTIRFVLNGWSNNAPHRGALATMIWREVEWLELSGASSQNWAWDMNIERQPDGLWRTTIQGGGADTLQGLSTGGVLVSRGLAVLDARFESA
jgi:hypothetical protein